MPRVGEVFVPGGLPSVTYNPREGLKLETRVRDYLDERHRILSLSGPTKCGKTVLLRRVIPESAAWLSGGSIPSVDGFWLAVTDKLGLYTREGTERSHEDADTTGTAVRGGGGIPTVLHGEGERTRSEQTSLGLREEWGRDRPAHIVAAEALRESLTPIVIDDFHYIPADAQLAIVRGLKELVFDGVPVILASVPHRAYDAVRVEKEMTGRVEQLQIEFWSDEELDGIATRGFEALNVTASDRVVNRLTKEAFRSPHLMQDFCLNLCKENGVREEQAGTAIELRAPDWNAFYAARAPGASKMAFDLLVQGPRQRSDRMERVLVDGTQTDIYGVVLAGIAATGPLTEIDYTELRSSIRDVLRSDAPQHHEVTRVLEKMSEIAREKIEGEPVVDYDDERNTLFISDPFFAFYLRWGTDPPLAAVRTNGRGHRP